MRSFPSRRRGRPIRPTSTLEKREQSRQRLHNARSTVIGPPSRRIGVASMIGPIVTAAVVGARVRPIYRARPHRGGDRRGKPCRGRPRCARKRILALLSSLWQSTRGPTSGTLSRPRPVAQSPVYPDPPASFRSVCAQAALIFHTGTVAISEPNQRVLARREHASGYRCAIVFPNRSPCPHPFQKRLHSTRHTPHPHQSCGEALRPTGLSRRLRDAKSHIYCGFQNQSTAGQSRPHMLSLCCILTAREERVKGAKEVAAVDALRTEGRERPR